MTVPSYAAVVDPLLNGALFPAEFAAAGVDTIAVISISDELLNAQSTWHPDAFAHVLRVSELGVDGVAARLRELRPMCLVPGCEAGVRLYEALVEQVLPGTGNVPGLAAARRDKWAMARALTVAGVPCLRQFCSADPDEIEKWLADTGLALSQFVVKPPCSGGTEDVHLVPAGADWRALFAQIVGKVNTTAERNEALLVQEFAAGTEYLVDSYSVDGRHGLVDVCRYTKGSRGDRIGIYDRVDFLAPDDPDAVTVWQYTQQVLDALGFRNGCGHAEVMLTPDGPRLLEIAERPAGGGHQTVSALATGSNHISRTVAHQVRGEVLPDYRLAQHVCAAFLSAPTTGVWTNAEVFAGVPALETLYDSHFVYGTGDVVPETVDLLTYLGWVILAAADPDAIEADYRRLKEMEARIRIEPDRERSAHPVGL